MKKILALLLAMLMIFALVACSGNKEDEDDGNAIESLVVENEFKNNDIGTFTYEVGKDGHFMITGYTSTSAADHEITVPAKIDDITVTGIADEAFKSCTTITSITLPDTLVYIGELAFYGCDKLTKITVPASVTEIGLGAFRNCAILKEVVLPANLTSIADQLFWECTVLKTVNLPEALTSIGESAFWNCDSLTSVALPTKVASVGKTAFYDCDALTSISVPESVKEIGDGAFASIDAEKVVISGKTGSFIENYFNTVYGINEKEYSHYEFKTVS